jgi:hypothetical protein
MPLLLHRGGIGRYSCLYNTVGRQLLSHSHSVGDLKGLLDRLNWASTVAKENIWNLQWQVRVENFSEVIFFCHIIL